MSPARDDAGESESPVGPAETGEAGAQPDPTPMMTERPLRRGRRAREIAKAETREALISAGIEAFAQEGLDVPSLDSICARAGYTRGAFYVHFKDREEFMVAVMQQVFQGFLDAIIATGDAALDLRRTIEAFVEAYQMVEFPTKSAIMHHHLLAACARSESLRGSLVQIIQEGMRRVTIAVGAGQLAGAVRADVGSGQVAALLTVLVFGLFSFRDLGEPVDVRAAATDLLKMLAPPANTAAP